MPTEKTAAERWYEGQRDSLKKDSIQAALNEYDESLMLLEPSTILSKVEEIAVVYRIVDDLDMFVNRNPAALHGKWLEKSGREFLNLVRRFASKGKMSNYYIGVNGDLEALQRFLLWCDTKIKQDEKLEASGVIRKAENIPEFHPEAVFGR